MFARHFFARATQWLHLYLPAALITGKPQSLKAELGQVGPAPLTVANLGDLP